MGIQEQVAIIVGAGPSGLATAACLTHLDIPYTIIEREDCYASLWKKKSYDRLHLHLLKQFCQLSHMPFPKTYPTYVSKKDFLQYLDDYVSHFNITPVYQTSVESAFYDGNTEKWNVKVNNLVSNEMDEYLCRFLIVASGETSDAFIPEVQGLTDFKGEVIHSTEYKCGEKYENKNVLVVGSGNSGMEIAVDLADYGAKTSIVVRSPVHVLSRGVTNLGLILLSHLPYQWVDNLVVLLSKIKYGDITKYGVERPNEGPFYMKIKYGKYPVIDAGIYKKITTGEIQVLPAIRSIRGNDVEFVNGKSHPFDAIIFATGFSRSTNKWLQGDDYLLNDNGISKQDFPNNWKGINGLYCAGLARRGLYGAAIDAENIANHIKTLL